MSRWFRMYDELLDDPKVQMLPPSLFKAWVNLLCLASRNGGILPEISAISFALRMDGEAAAETLTKLVERGLIDRDEAGDQPHNWNERQFKSDVSTDRVKRFRKRFKAQGETGNETPPETEAETDTEKVLEPLLDRPEDNNGFAGKIVGQNGKYAFQGETIKLTHRDFGKWLETYPNLSLAAELASLDHWAGEQGKSWFHAVQGALGKKEREASERMKFARIKAELGNKPQTPIPRIGRI